MKASQAIGAHWGLAVKAALDELSPLPAATNLGFVYVTPGFADDLSSIVTFLRETSPVQNWLGGVGYGVVGPQGAVQGDPAIVLMVGSVEAEAVRVFDGFDPEEPHGFQEQHGGWLDRQSGVTALVHGNPRDPRLGDMVTTLAETGRAFLVGGLTATADTPSQVAGRVSSHGLTGAMFGDRIPLTIGLTQGCQPIGDTLRITEAVDNVLISLNGKPALDALKEAAGDIIARDLKRASGFIHIALPIEGSDNPHAYVVRTLVGIDPKRGWLAIGGHVEKGDRLMFVRRDANAARQDMDRMLHSLSTRVAGREIRGGVYISCAARGAQMFGHADAETDMIRDVLGDFPFIGYSAAGEICHDRLYGYTGILALFL